MVTANGIKNCRLRRDFLSSYTKLKRATTLDKPTFPAIFNPVCYPFVAFLIHILIRIHLSSHCVYQCFELNEQSLG